MTEVLAPPVGEVLTAETVKLLVKGDMLLDNLDGSTWTFDMTGSSGLVCVSRGDKAMRIEPDAFTFHSRPSLAAPTVQVEGQDSGLLPPREASVPTEQAVMSCPQCEGEGEYADGLDEAACSTPCTRCAGNGWIVDLSALSRPVAADGEVSASDAGREAIWKVIHEVWQMLDDGESDGDGIVTVDQDRYRDVSEAMDRLEALVPETEGPFWGGYPVNYFWGLK